MKNQTLMFYITRENQKTTDILNCLYEYIHSHNLEVYSFLISPQYGYVTVVFDGTDEQLNDLRELISPFILEKAK